MKGYTKFPKKHLYIILGVAGILIFLLSLDVMVKVKDMGLFEHWVNTSGVDKSITDENGLFQTYLTINLSMYFQKIVVPMGLSIHTYFSYTKLRVNTLYIFIWTVLLIGSLAYMLLDLDYGAVYSYLYLLLYSVIIVTVLSLISVIEKRENT